jgi:aspartokinase/homoserine dehydrogenase 1
VKTLVMKFGGTSVGSAETIGRTVNLVQAAHLDWLQLVVIVSALSGVTDALLKGAHSAASGDSNTYRSIARELRQRHLDTLQSLPLTDQIRAATSTAIQDQLQEFEALCHAVYVLGEASPRALDAIASLGERMSVRLVAAALDSSGLTAQPIEATELIVTDANYQSATPLIEPTQAKAAARLRPLLEQNIIPVVTGFIGATSQGLVTTLGRGGSDYSAALLGVALNADEVWIWTDVDGVMTADPRRVPSARTLPELTFREISELAYYGAKVLHPKTIRPVVERGIALWVKNTFNPTRPGTRIVKDNGQAAGVIKAVTAIRGQTMLTVEGRGMLGVPGVAARTFGAVARTKTSVSLITQASSEQSICFTVPAASGSSVIEALHDEFQHELDRHDIDAIAELAEVVIVTVVGAGMRHTPGIAGRIFSALGAAGVNVIAIAQGSSECSISLIVAAGDADPAVNAIHGLIVSAAE